MNDQSTNIWQYKPWWCQPWSILLTGICIIAGSWFVFTKLWLTTLVAVPILAWMIFFLIIYPQQMQAYLRKINSSDDSSN
ncbi:hypothetical protein Q2T42_23175 [Leptolyngbya boryana CZ1]|uniref:DUF6737 domain-containing protein n=1 Tax=Leptolyngbya boryana CZ1 TaxID=3060204 RepID=A0AA96WSK0_LEPBY|nr:MULTISPECIES: DUF6737 family protein [Leptolyngbya]MBN8559502.1 hypothetical protein [Leptolyngbya sp. UWPOB_LEPTO1]WNZ44698.1 hypothetical protein Q2T42_23175 [Leptolyngbya boryana CZ1]